MTINLRRGDFEAMHPKAKLFGFDECKKLYTGDGVESINDQWTTWCACIAMLYLEAKAQAVPEWISVEDRLPELKEHTWRTALPVNVMIDGYGQYLCYPCQYSNGVFYWADATYYGNDEGEHPIKCDRGTEVLNVTHWMPLPDAPREQTHDN